VLTPPDTIVVVVLAAALYKKLPETSQSPAVKLMETILEVEPEVRDTALDVAVIYSPILPAWVLSAAIVPTIPIVLVGVIRPDAPIVVACTALGVVAPNEGGAAKVLATKAVVAS
jgi:hypothetical protein